MFAMIPGLLRAISADPEFRDALRRYADEADRRREVEQAMEEARHAQQH